MTPLFKKLNLGERREIVVLGAPKSFESELAALQDVAVRRDARKLASASFALIFVTTIAEIERAARRLADLDGDPVVWFAYPKKTSKRYQVELHRDAGWNSLGAAGYEGVRQVSIDDDWSALRFRRELFVKKLARDPSRAITEVGKRRATARKQGDRPDWAE